MEIKEYASSIEKAIQSLPKGAFLTTKSGEKINTMTIGWGSFGFMWGMPVFEALVRESRFTKALIDSSGEFTVTFPYGDEQKSNLAFCGSKSGRDFDKIKECSLPLADAKTISTPVVSCHGLVLECKVVMELTMDAEKTSSEVLDKWYKNGDLHTLYYGKIEACYEI